MAGTPKQHKTIFHGTCNVVSHEGLLGLYKGITASLLRECTQSTLRLGLYEPFKVWFGGVDQETTTLQVKILAGSASGLVGAVPCNPTDVLKVRMQAWVGTPKPLTWHI